MYELFEQKYKECEKALFLVAFGYLHNTEDAKDCVQEAVLSALKSFNSLNNKEFFKTWLTRIVINKSKDYLKKQRFTEELTDNLNVFYDMPTDEIGIMDCICKLSPKLSIYITLRFYNDMTYDEVARTLKLPVSTVKYKTKKALNELKTLLEGDAK
ncbi:MAG: sigma-70 family RNA polymerase sigma factor [Clostridia bacterium]|nr:sigma-70 family RNA polymerase sigma factor [Clostridia bacterium]